ncbi:zonadhesin-like [Arctopsyche grandis]|uniref:zonadhesin-like n=1 Tax=Arctopsyche grandis TaxID=121162 RepID=UPI00406DA0E6
MRISIIIIQLCLYFSKSLATSVYNPPKLVCKANEVIDPCPRPCPPEANCEQYLTNIQYLCAEVPPGTPCVPGCRCASGLVRSKSGVCINPINCCDDPNAEVVDCPSPCPPTCDQPSPASCSDACQLRGCQCKTGYILNNGKCIPINQCPKPLCSGPNEVYVSCKDPCPETCASIFDAGPKPQCLPRFPCPAGCNCISGYVSNKNNICVKKEDCPPPLICKTNEVLNLCGKPCIPGVIQTCSEYMKNATNDCPPSPKFPCVPQCDCASGFYRNSNGNCVKPEDCCDDANEIMVDCPDPCPLTCDNLETHGKFPCARMCLFRGCTCRPGFARDAKLKCIPIAQCPSKCKPNEVLNPCAGYCTFDDDCGSVVFGFIRDCAAPPEDFQCQPRCECKRGLVRINEDCVSVEKCCTDPNEESTDCPAPCDETCESKPAADCQLQPCFKKGCRCKKGYVRNGSGACILKEKCPSCSNPNEVYRSCGTACEPTCDNKTPMCTFQCVSGCFCKDGYIRNNKKQCIPIDTCPKPCTGQNEEFKECGTCDPSCANLTPACLFQKKCIQGCFCKSGFARDYNQKCVDVKSCPPKSTTTPKTTSSTPYTTPKSIVCGLFETHTTCVPEKEPTCADHNTIVSKCCKPGCTCMPGYVRDNRKCIAVKDCKTHYQVKYTRRIYRLKVDRQSLAISTNMRISIIIIPLCLYFSRSLATTVYDPPKPLCSGPNEVYVSCKDPCPETCVSIFDSGPKPQCSAPFPCPAGCNCISGYVRDQNNKCVKKEDCPPPLICKQNEVLNPCAGYCTFDNDCGSVIFGFIRDCAAPPIDFQCQPRCDCKTGLVRIDGECVTMKKCCTDQNSELTDCPAPCDDTCESKPAADCQLQPCSTKGCRCKKGYVRNGSGACILKEKCPSCSNPNEVYSSCGTACEPTCDNRTPICTFQCVSGCFCKDGYIRNNKKQCIPIDTCPKPCTGQNEEFKECGTCDPSCANLTPACLFQKNCIQGCFCKSGFARDSNKKCVDIKSCPPKSTTTPKPTTPTTTTPKPYTSSKPIVCGLFEMHTTCVPEKEPTCADRITIASKHCKPGCKCMAGYVRHNGKCITLKDCKTHYKK